MDDTDVRNPTGTVSRDDAVYAGSLVPARQRDMVRWCDLQFTAMCAAFSMQSKLFRVVTSVLQRVKL